MPIDTHVDSDPASCRITAQWLDGVSRAGRTAADGVLGARNDSAGCWSGPAGDAFRDLAGRVGAAGDTTSTQARIGAQALDEFATSVQGVLDTMARARADAAGAGLPVIGETIGDPVPAPGDLPTPPSGQLLAPAEVAAHLQAVAAADAQRAAYDQAVIATDDARRRYVEAQDDLVDRMRAPTSEAVATAKGVLLAVSSVTSTLGGLRGAAIAWGAAAERAAQQRAVFMTLSLTDALPVEDAARGALQAGDELARAQAAGGATEVALRRATVGASETSAGRMVLDGLLRFPGHTAQSGLIARAAPVLRNVPYTSLGFAAAGGVADVAAGRSVGSAVAKQATTLAAGAGATWAATAGGTALAAAVGATAVAALPVTLVAIAAGAGVAYLVGANWDSIEAGAEELLP